MKKHRGKLLLLAVLVAAALGASAGLRWLRPERPVQRVNPYTATKVRLGMTQKEVEAIFRAPPGDYSTAMRGHHAEGLPKRPPELRREDWTADEGGAVVYFGDDGRVADCILWIEPNYMAKEGAVRFRLRKWCYELGVW
jgi:hypothetical protein